jgi:GNAT superfamily N-acetyltransferase
MAFRQATATDLDGLIRLQTDYYREDGYPHRLQPAREAWSTLLTDGSRGRVWVVESSPGELVAYLVVTFGYSLEFLGRDAFVDELYVVESWRGRGLGQEALDVAQAACRDLGVHALHLEVENTKHRVAALYRRSGFVDHQRHLMTKWLRPPG